MQISPRNELDRGADQMDIVRGDVLSKIDGASAAPACSNSYAARVAIGLGEVKDGSPVRRSVRMI
jgi:hypothetical protein